MKISLMLVVSSILFPTFTAFNPRRIFSSFVLSCALQTEATLAASPNEIQTMNNNIYFYGPVTSESCQQLASILISLDNQSKMFRLNFDMDPPPIRLHIQSEGGQLLNAFYVVDLIEQLETPVFTYVDGFAASSASLISVVGKKRFMTENSFLMIHQLSSYNNEGKINEMNDNIVNLNKFMETLQSIYWKKTNLHRDKLKQMLEHDIWLSANECLEYGFIDEIL